MAQAKQVTKRADDVDLDIRPREIVALVGESGSGKSTVARLLSLLYRPTSGRILFRGEPVEGQVRESPAKGAKPTTRVWILFHLETPAILKNSRNFSGDCPCGSRSRGASAATDGSGLRGWHDRQSRS